MTYMSWRTTCATRKAAAYCTLRVLGAPIPSIPDDCLEPTTLCGSPCKHQRLPSRARREILAKVERWETPVSCTRKTLTCLQQCAHFSSAHPTRASHQLARNNKQTDIQ